MSSQAFGMLRHATQSVAVATLGFAFIVGARIWIGREAAEFVAVVACALWRGRR